MKKIAAVLSLLLLVFPMFGAVFQTGNLAEITGESPTVIYALNPHSAATDTFKIGFATGAVTDFSDVTNAAALYTLSVDEGTFVGKLDDSLYVYWQIASQNSAKITLTATSLEYDSGTDKYYLNVTLNTTAGRSGEPSAEDGNTVTDSTTNDTAGISHDLLTYNTSVDAFPSGQCAGSQKIALETESVYGAENEEYQGTLTLTISSGN